jgi:hypothetical protein
LFLTILIASSHAMAAGALVVTARDKNGVFVYGACANAASVAEATNCAMALCKSKTSVHKACKTEVVFGPGRTLVIVPTVGGRATVQLAESTEEAIAEAYLGCKEEFEDTGRDACLIERAEVFTEAAEKITVSLNAPNFDALKHAEPSQIIEELLPNASANDSASLF